MGCCKSKGSKLDIQNNLLNINVGKIIINLYKNQSEYNYTNNLNSAIKLYEYEKELNHNLELDYVTKCIIVMSFIRDIDKVLNNQNEIKNLHEIDIVSLDIEGGELNCLYGFDLQKYKPKILVIEDAFNNKVLDDYMSIFGYRIDKYISYNKYFIHNDFKLTI